MNLIGINGFKRSGKGATADIVKKLHGGNVQFAGFADKLKILAAKTLGYTDCSDSECVALMDEAKECWVIDIVRMGSEDFMPYSPGRLNTEATTVTAVGGLTGRQYLQNLGNEAREVFGDTFWIDMVLPPVAYEGWEDTNDRILAMRYPDVDVLCITDLRYPNEAERIKALGGEVWEVIRPGLVSDGHASELPLPRELVDYVITNDGTLDDLEAQVGAMVESLV